MSFWLDSDGKRLIADGGEQYVCADCPCDDGFGDCTLLPDVSVTVATSSFSECATTFFSTSVWSAGADPAGSYTLTRELSPDPLRLSGYDCVFSYTDATFGTETTDAVACGGTGGGSTFDLTLLLTVRLRRNGDSYDLRFDLEVAFFDQDAFSTTTTETIASNSVVLTSFTPRPANNGHFSLTSAAVAWA